MINGDNSRRLVIAGTGHRPQKLNPMDPNDRSFGFTEGAQNALRDTIREALIEIRLQHPDHELTVISGVALGYDQALAETALEQGLKVIAAVPFEGQEKAWRPDSQRTYLELLDRIVEHGGEVHIVSEGGYSASKMQVRNEWMVDRADLMLALQRGQSAGGTKNCLDYAERNGKESINVWNEYSRHVGRQIQRTIEPRFQPPTGLKDRIDVVHVNRYKGVRDESFIYIGREMPAHSLAQSPLANPYHIGPDGTRAEVIEKYQTWLRAEFQDQSSPARAELLRIKELVASGARVSLGCWCSPQQCHGEVVRDAVVKLIERDRSLVQAAETRIPERAGVAAAAPARPPSQAEAPEHSSTNSPAGREAPAAAAQENPSIDHNGLSYQARAAHIEIESYNPKTDDYRALFEPQDGLTRAEHSSKLNQTNPEARDAYERGATITDGDVLVIPKEFNSLPPQINITTHQHAVLMISAFIPEESVAQEKAGELITLAEQICGSFSSERARITIFQHLYSQITQDEHGHLLPLEERADALERTLELSRTWAQEMVALEPQEIEQFGLDEVLEQDSPSNTDPLHDENDLYAEIYTEAVEHYQEQVPGVPDHLEVEAERGGALPQTLYERTSLAGLPPALPEEISLETQERIFTKTLPSIDRALESGTSREEIMRGIYSTIALRDRTDQAARVQTLFAAAGDTGHNNQTPREDTLNAYTSLRVLVSGALDKENSRYSSNVLESARGFYEQNPASEERAPRRLLNQSIGQAHPNTAPQAKEFFTAHERDIRLSQQNLLRLDRIPTRGEVERIEELEQALSSITATIERIAPDQSERLSTLTEIGGRAAFVISSKNRELSTFEQAEKTARQISERLARPLAFDSIRTHLADELSESEREIDASRNSFLKAAGFIPESSQHAREHIQPYITGMERNLEIVQSAQAELGDSSHSFEARAGDGVGPVYVALAGHGSARLPLGNSQEYAALQRMAESCKLSVTTFHGLYGGEITGHSEERTAVARFISNYTSYRLANSETRLLNRSAEYRIYSERLGGVTTLEELRDTSRDIRRENYARSQQVQAHQRDPESVMMPAALDPSTKNPARPLTSYEMRQLFNAPAPDHYTDEMCAYRQGLSVTGRDKERMTEALTRGEIQPSTELAALLTELDQRRTAPALNHYTRSLLKSPAEMERPSSFDLHATYEKLLPYERDYLYSAVTGKKLALKRERSAVREQSQPRADETKEQFRKPESLKELTSSQIFRDYYGVALWQEAQLFTTERTRREEGQVRGISQYTITPVLSDRQIDAAGYVLHNFDARQAKDVANHLKNSSDEKTQLAGEILGAFSGIREETRSDGRTEVSLTVPDNSRFTEGEWKNLLDYLRPDNSSDNKFLKDKLPTSQLSQIRQEAQGQAWTTLEESLQLQSHHPDSRADTLYQSLEVKEAIASTNQHQAKARTAHHALEQHLEACTSSIEARLAEPGRFLSHPMALRVASHAATVTSYAASFAGQPQISRTLAWTSARLKESASAADHVARSGASVPSMADREVTKQLVHTALDPAQARLNGNSELISQHEDQYNLIRQSISPQQEQDYRKLKTYATTTKEDYLKEFSLLDEKSRALTESRQQDTQTRSDSARSTGTPESRAQADFQQEYETARSELTEERLDAMIKDGTLPPRTDETISRTVSELLPEAARSEIDSLAREAAWWNMVPAEARGDSTDSGRAVPGEVIDRALETSDKVSAARAAEGELERAREELSSFITQHVGSTNDGTHVEGEMRAPEIEAALTELAGHDEAVIAIPEALLSTLGAGERAELERLTEAVNLQEATLAQSFSEIDRSREQLDLTREEYELEERIERFNEIREPLAERMKEYLSQAIGTEGPEAFHDQMGAERHASRLADTMRECIEDHNMSLSDLNLRADDVQEIAQNLVSSMTNTFEHNHTISREPFNNPELNQDMTQRIETLDLANLHVNQIQDFSHTTENTHAAKERAGGDDLHEMHERSVEQPKSIDKEQTEGTGGMETIDLDQERVSDHLEHAHELAQVLIR